MKIAFVSQPIDYVLPPYQNSVGACTYGAATSLAKEHKVVVFAPASDGVASHLLHRNVTYRFVKTTIPDRVIHKVRTRLSRVIDLQPVSSSPLNHPQYGASVAHEISLDNFDVIHIQHLSQYVPIIRKRNPRAKLVLHLHAEWFSQCKPRELIRRVEAVDMLTGVSDYVSQRVHQLLPTLGKQCVTHYNGFDPSEFSSSKDYQTLLQRPERHIMYAGGISPHKGLHVLIEAFNTVVRECPNVRLNLFGPAGTYPFEETFDMRDRALRAQLEAYYSNGISPLRKAFVAASSSIPDYASQLKSRMSAEVADKVSFRGNVPREELVRSYYESDLFVFPSLFAEGFGLPPVEAMAAGTPVVAARSGAIVETVSHGESGLLVEKNDPRALAGAMLTILKNAGLGRKLGTAARARALNYFTWDHVTEPMALNYGRLCGCAKLAGCSEEPLRRQG